MDTPPPPKRRMNDRERDPTSSKIRGVDTESQTILNAAIVIQRYWRNIFRRRTTLRLVQDYFKNGPTIQHVKNISFETLVALLREPRIISVSKKLLQRLHLLATFLHGSPSKTLTPENVNVRVFLAAFMISYRPTHVFESLGALEQDLLETAIPMLELFEKIGLQIMESKSKSFSGIPPALSEGFPTMLFTYLGKFKAWKVPDEAKLTCRIKHALIALYNAEEHLPSDEPEDSKLKIEFKTQIERLRSKLQQIAGADALTEFDEAHPRRAAAPNGVAAPTSVGAAAMPGRMTNEQLAHELLLDPHFQLDENGGCSVENPVFHRIRESFHQAFWDSLVDDLRLASPCYVRVLRVLGEIRDGINDLAGGTGASNIMELVDLDFIKQQAEKGLYGWNGCTSLIQTIIETIQRVQAPKRDDETKAKWKIVSESMANADVVEQPRILCKALEFLLERVNAMRIDAANARLRLIAPVIRDHGIDYERGKLTDKLNDGTLTLARTQEMISETIRTEVGMNNVPLQSLLDGRASAFTQIHTAAILSLVAGRTTAVTAENCPETLLFDAHRLEVLRNEFESILSAGTMLAAVEFRLGASRRQTFLEFAGTFQTRRAFVMDTTVIEIRRMLERTTISGDVREPLVSAVQQTAVPNDPDDSFSRLRTFLMRIVVDGATPSDIQLPFAMRTLVPRIEQVATTLRTVIDLNRNVHLAYYNVIIRDEAQKLLPPSE